MVAGAHPDLALDWRRWRHGTRKADPLRSVTDAEGEEEESEHFRDGTFVELAREPCIYE